MNWEVISHRNPPQQPEPEELLKSIERRIQEFEIQNVKSIFQELYRQHYRQTFIGFRQPPDITGIKRIIALCRYRGWSVRDFIEVNVQWYVDCSKYRPLPRSLCGPVSENRYIDFLCRSGYGDNVEIRNDEVERLTNAANRIHELAAKNLLPGQIEEAAKQYAAQKAKEAVVTPEMLAQLNVPRFMGPRQREEHCRQQIFYQAKADYMRGWDSTHGQSNQA